MGKIIVIDGLDGSGKNTQASLLRDNLKDLGYRVKLFSFPRYESDSSTLIKMYLGGKIDKDANNVNPYAASILYTADRYIQFKVALEKYLNTDTILIFDRYISANIIHQGSKIQSIEEKYKFYDWCYDLEVNKLGLPRESLTVLLKVKPDISARLIAERNRKTDIHEQNKIYLNSCYENAKIASEYNNWRVIDCNKGDDSIRDIEDIQKELLSIVLKEIGGTKE